MLLRESDIESRPSGRMTWSCWQLPQPDSRKAFPKGPIGLAGLTSVKRTHRQLCSLFISLLLTLDATIHILTHLHLWDNLRSPS